MIGKLFQGALCALLLTGCATKDNEQIQLLTEIRAELQKSNENLDKINKKIAGLENNSPQTAAFVRKDVDVAALSKIKLPDNPTEEQIAEYIRKIVNATANQNSFSPNDPQVKMYSRIGTGHLATVLPFTRMHGAFHLRYALKNLVAKTDKEFVLKNVEYTPSLIDSIIRYGWVPDAKKNILNSMKATQDFYIFRDTIPFFAETPEDRLQLVEIFRRNPGASMLASTIETFSDINKEKLAKEMWDIMRFQNRRLEYVIFAVKHGVKDAFPALFKSLLEQNRPLFIEGYNMISLPFLINDLLNQTTSIDETIAWFNANKDKLVFDKEKGRYFIPASTEKKQ